MKYLLFIFTILHQAIAISKTNFNLCRTSYCVFRQQQCINTVGQCFQSFALTRMCLKNCHQTQYYNYCWSQCRQQTSQPHYLNVVSCYENICYLSTWIIQFSLLILIFIALI